MPCYHPLHGYRSAELTKNGKRKIVFSPKYGFVDMPMSVPCGQCVGCRLERSRQWALRCVHEASLHESSAFLTLTYSDDCLPEGGTLVKKHFQDFMKRLRRRLGRPLRYFHCGEYGELSLRPHYHAILYGFDFPDKTFHTRNAQGNTVWKSKFLDELWSFGQCTIGAVTFETAAYTARYVMKKVTGEAAQSHYQSVDVRTGEIIQRVPEYVTMSLKPAIGRLWFDRFSSDVYPADSVVLRGKEMKPPKYYDLCLQKENEFLYDSVKFRRIGLAKANPDNTVERLAVREEVKLSRIKSLKRDKL